MDKTRSRLSRALEAYRKEHHMSQADMGDYLFISERTYRRWIAGDSVTDTRELVRVAKLLEIEPETLGILPEPENLTREDAEARLSQVWDMVRQAKNERAKLSGERLIKDLFTQIDSEDSELLRVLANVHYVTGYVTSLVTPTSKLKEAVRHFDRMETIARLLDDDTLLNIALTYNGDMYRRGGYVDKAVTYLEAARDTTPRASLEAKGNGIQLLGRAYAQSNKLDDCEYSLGSAYEIVTTLKERGVTNGLYCEGTVLEEYGRSYGTLGQMNKALHYFDKAERSLPKEVRWDILLKTSRAVTLVRGGEIIEGSVLACEAGKLCVEYKNVRCLERVQSIERYLDKLSKQASAMSVTIRESIEGEIGQWELSNS